MYFLHPSVHLHYHHVLYGLEFQRLTHITQQRCAKLHVAMPNVFGTSYLTCAFDHLFFTPSGAGT